MVVRSFFIIRIVDWCFLRTVAYLFALNQAFPLFFRFQRFPKHIFSFPFDICFQSTTINFNAHLWCKEIKNRLGVSPRGSNYCQITKTKRKTISTLPLQISAPALSLAAICDRLPTDVGMMALRTVTSIRTIIHCTCLCLPQRFSRAAAPPWIRYLQSGAQRIECAQFSTPLSYSSSLVLHLIAAYTIATSGHFPIAHLSFCDPFLF